MKILVMHHTSKYRPFRQEDNLLAGMSAVALSTANVVIAVTNLGEAEVVKDRDGTVEVEVCRV